MERTEIVGAVLGWTPLLISLTLFFWFMRRSLKRSRHMEEVAKHNTRAVEANTAAVMQLIEELRAARR